MTADHRNIRRKETVKRPTNCFHRPHRTILRAACANISCTCLIQPSQRTPGQVRANSASCILAPSHPQFPSLNGVLCLGILVSASHHDQRGLQLPCRPLVYPGSMKNCHGGCLLDAYGADACRPSWFEDTGYCFLLKLTWLATLVSSTRFMPLQCALNIGRCLDSPCMSKFDPVS